MSGASDTTEDKSTLGAERSDKGSQKRAESLAITSVEQAMGVFMKESVGVYVKQKNNEHLELDPATNKEIREWTKEDLGNLLNGISDKATGPKKEEIQKAVDSMKSNLDKYVAKLDENLSKKRDAVLKENGISIPNGLAKDKALVEAAKKSSYAKAGEALASGSLNADSPKKNVTLKRLKAKALEAISGVFKFCGNKSKSEEYAKYAEEARSNARVNAMKKMFGMKQDKVPQTESKGISGKIQQLKKSFSMER